MIQVVSQRGWFDYHFISMEPTERDRNGTVFDQTATRDVMGENDDGDVVPIDTVPNWKSVREPWPMMQYVICTGDGDIVDRIPVRGSRHAQATKASSLLLMYAKAVP